NAERLLPVAEPRDDERAERDRPDPRQLVEERGEPRDEVVEEVREAVEDVEEEARVRHVALVAQPVLEAVEVADERVPDERVGPRLRVLPGEEPDQHPGDDEEDEHVAAPPPRPRGGDGGDGYCVVRRRRQRQSSSPAIASRTAVRSTTPTTRPSSTTPIGRSLAAITGTARRTVIDTGNVVPSTSPG